MPGVEGRTENVGIENFYDVLSRNESRLRTCWKEGDFAGVIESASEVLSLVPNNESALRFRLRAMNKLGDCVGYVEAAVAAAIVASDDAKAAARRLISAREWEAAAEVLIALQAVSPDVAAETVEVRTRVAGRLAAEASRIAKAGDFAAAVRQLLLGRRLAPEDDATAKVLSGLRAKATERVGGVDFDTDASGYVAVWRDVVLASPDDVNGLKRLAIACEKLEDHDSALEYWAHLLRLDSTQVKIVQRMLRIAVLAKRERAALVLLYELGVKALDDTASRKVLHAVRKECRKALSEHDFGAAGQLYLLLAKTSPDPAVFADLTERLVSRSAGQVRRAGVAGDVAEAVRLARLLVAIDDGNQTGLAHLARHAYKLRSFVEAAGYYERLVGVDGENSNAWLGLARCREKTGDPSGAVDAARRCLAIDPERAAAKQIVAALAPAA